MFAGSRSGRRGSATCSSPAVAPAEDRHAARVGGEEQRRLARRVAGADDVDVDAVRARTPRCARRRRRCPCRRAARSRPCELTPRHPGGEDDRPRAQHVAAVEVDLAGRRIDPLDRAGDEDLRAEPARLLQRAAGELVPRDAGGEAEVVLDPRGGAGLAAGRLALDDDRAQPLRRAVDRGREAGGSGADDDGVVLGGARLGAEARAARRPGAGAAGRRSCRRRRGWSAGPRRRAAARPSARSASGASGASHSNVTWLRSRKRRRSCMSGPSGGRRRSRVAGGGSAARLCSPRAPLIRCEASRPTALRPRARRRRSRGSRAPRSA